MILKNFRVLSGMNGADKVIKRISVYDSPVRDDILERKLIKNGDFLITSMFFQKSSGSLINDFIKMLKDAGCVGIFASNQYLQELPGEVLAYSDEIAFPIIQFDMSVPYAEIIEVVMGLILTSQNHLINELRIDKLLKEKLTIHEVKDVALEMNANFKENICVVYIHRYALKDNSLSKKFLIDMLNINREYSAFHYKGSIMIIATFSKNNLNVNKSMIKLILQEMEKYIKDFIVGVSDFHGSLKELDTAINEAIFASRNSQFSEENVSYYSEIGINRLLIPIIGNKELEKFYSNLVGPILEHDRRFHGELMKTAVSFVKNQGDYKKTADEFFQHQNTIRYRINKVKTLLNITTSDFEFYENLSMAIRIARIFKVGDWL